MNDNQPDPADTSVPPVVSRRDFVKIAGATGATALLAQLFTTGPLSPDEIQGIQRHGHASGEHEWHMAIDLDKCIGCHYCLWACQAVNDVADDDMRWNVGFQERTDTGVEFFMTRPCLHCQNAPCTRVCPVGATWVREDGIVEMDYARCIGCRYCQVACPYDARRFNWREPTDENNYLGTWGLAEVDRRPRGVVEKCTFCVHRIDRAMENGTTPGIHPAATPACVNICPVGARVFGDVKDEESPISRYLAEHETFRLREELGTEPKVHYIRPQRSAGA